ncbi:hypothetical protein ABIB95_007122 [Bradyrhizobium sp. LA2.1]
MGPGSAAHRRTGRCCASPGKRCAASGAREQILALHSNSNRTHGFASSWQDLPELCSIHLPQKCRGRREGRVPAGTRGPLCGNCATKFAQWHTGEAKHPAFPAQWFYGLCRALPGERCAIAPVTLRMTDVRARSGRHITARLGAQAPSARTARFYRTQAAPVVCARRSLTVARPANHLRVAAACVHHAPSRVS